LCHSFSSEKSRVILGKSPQKASPESVSEHALESDSRQAAHTRLTARLLWEYPAAMKRSFLLFLILANREGHTLDTLNPRRGVASGFKIAADVGLRRERCPVARWELRGFLFLKKRVVAALGAEGRDGAMAGRGLTASRQSGIVCVS
jgi:hypothetical protein